MLGKIAPYHRRLPIWMTCAFLAGLAPAATEAQWSVDPQSQEVSQATGDYLVSLRAKNMDLVEVLRNLAGQVGATLAVSESISGKISLELRDAKLRDTMDNICQAYSCDWSLATNQRLMLVVQGKAGG